jgi:hypothetical protein
MTVIPFVSSMQWRHDVYGTVAQLNGVGFGKLTSLLAQTVDATSGERLFVTDTFSAVDPSMAADSYRRISGSGGGGRHSLSLSGMLSRYDVFAAHVRDTSGFDERSVDPTRQLYIHRGQLDELWHDNASGSLLMKSADIPQFRLVVVGRDTNSSLLALETAVCFLRDGGLILVNNAGVENDVADTSTAEPELHHQQRHHHHQMGLGPVVDAFFSRHGRSTIAPLLSTGNKVYLTTTNFRRQYFDHIIDNSDWLSLHVGRSPYKAVTPGLGGFEFLRL